LGNWQNSELDETWATPILRDFMSTDELKIRRIEFAGSILDIEYRGLSAERVLAFLFRDLTQPDSMRETGESAHFTYRLESDPKTDILRLYHAEELEWECASEGEMAVHLIGQACYQLANFSAGGLVLHAALVGQGGQGILLPGSTGKGKSSLAAWLLQCGYDYLTDELVYIANRGARNGYGLRRPLNLKKSARPLLNEVFQISSATPGLMTSTSVDLIPFERFGNGNGLSQIPICAVIFPCFRSETAFELRQLSKAQASLELMQCLINARNLPEHGFPEVIGMARTVPAYQLVYSDFSTVESAVQAALRNLNSLQ
jgi:hypothetical protein